MEKNLKDALFVASQIREFICFPYDGLWQGYLLNDFDPIKDYEILKKIDEFANRSFMNYRKGSNENE